MKQSLKKSIKSVRSIKSIRSMESFGQCLPAVHATVNKAPAGSTDFIDFKDLMDFMDLINSFLERYHQAHLQLMNVLIQWEINILQITVLVLAHHLYILIKRVIHANRGRM